jgi:hypothetical protein
MEQTDKNVLMEMALDLDLVSLTNLCKTSKKMNETICANEVFWMKKLYKDYPITVGKIPVNFSTEQKQKISFKRIYESLVKKVTYVYEVFLSQCDPIGEPPKFWDYMKKGKKYLNYPMSEEDYDVAEKLYPDFNERCGEEFKFKMIGDFPTGTKIWLRYTTDRDLDFRDAVLSKEIAIKGVTDILDFILRNYYEYDRAEFEEHYGMTVEEFYDNKTKEELLKYFTQELNEKGKIKFHDMRTDTNEWYIVREFTIINYPEMLEQLKRENPNWQKLPKDMIEYILKLLK